MTKQKGGHLQSVVSVVIAVLQNRGYYFRTLYWGPFYFFSVDYKAGGCGQEQQAERQGVASLLCGRR